MAIVVAVVLFGSGYIFGRQSSSPYSSAPIPQPIEVSRGESGPQSAIKSGGLNQGGAATGRGDDVRRLKQVPALFPRPPDDPIGPVASKAYSHWHANEDLDPAPKSPNNPSEKKESSKEIKQVMVKKKDPIWQLPKESEIMRLPRETIQFKTKVRDPFKTMPLEDPEPNHPATGKLLAWVLTCPEKHDTKALAVNRTWGPRFDHLLYMTSEPFAGLNTVILDIENESREVLWPKARMAWMHVFNNYINQADWFMKVDDDSYVMVDNLRKFLQKYDHNEPHYLGRGFVLRRGTPQELEYNSGGAGYVLSREALRQLGMKRLEAMDSQGKAEDVEMARSMLKLGIVPEDTRDDEGREQFLPLNINHIRYKHKRERKPKHWFWRYSRYPPVEDIQCCSRFWISTHYAFSQDLYEFEQLFLNGEEGCGRDPTPERQAPYREQWKDYGK